MKKDQIRIGGTYLAKVSDKVVPVRLDAESRYGGWDATNMATNKKVRIKSAQRLRGPAPERTAPRGPTPEEAAILAAAIGHAPANAPVESTQSSTTRGGRRQRRPGEQTPVNTTKPQSPNTADPAANAGQPNSKPLSLLDAAAHILSLGTGEHPGAMRCKDLVDLVVKRQLWTPGPRGGKTPASTLYASILRELTTKGTESRFIKTERGKFALKDSQYLREQAAKAARQA